MRRCRGGRAARGDPVRNHVETTEPGFRTGWVGTLGSVWAMRRPGPLLWIGLLLPIGCGDPPAEGNGPEGTAGAAATGDSGSDGEGDPSGGSGSGSGGSGQSGTSGGASEGGSGDGSGTGSTGSDGDPTDGGDPASTSGGGTGGSGTGGDDSAGETEGASSGGGDSDGSDPDGVEETPPYVGPNFSDSMTGSGLIRTGPVVRVPGCVYQGDPLEPYRRDTTFVHPATTPHVLSNPYRDDGTGLNAGYYIPADFTGHIPVYTEGNWWPYIGPYQPQPPHGDFEADSGIYFIDGQPVPTVEPKVLRGESGAIVRNETGCSILLSAGSYPGNEQPGQVMTPVNPGEEAAMPIPPRGWYPDGSGNPRVPELYVSVAGLDPMDVPGWHESNTTPDYGTPGFAYTLGAKYTPIEGASQQFLFAGFNKNEGYDPTTSGDPGYGVALYMTEPGGSQQLVALTDIYMTGAAAARQELWAIPRFNPQVNAQGGLSAFPAGPEGTQFAYVFLEHDAVQELLQGQSGVLSLDY